MNSLILLASLLVLIFMGVPIIIAMGVAIMLTSLIGAYPIQLFAQILISTASNWTFLAVPFFIIAGSLMNDLGLTNRLFGFARAGVGHIKGGLCHVNVLASMIFAGISGSSVADVGGLGKIELKAMKDAGFSGKVSAGITVASSVIGPIIPPSIAFVLYGIMAEVSIAKLFLAGLLPGLMVGLSLMLMTYLQAIRHPRDFPTEERATFKEYVASLKKAALALLAPIIILFGMSSGFISPTEAGAIAALYTIVIGFVYKTINLKKMWTSIKESILQSAQAIMLVSLAGVIGYIMIYERTPYLFAELISGIMTSKWLVLSLANVVFLVIGTVMSATAGLIILTPIFVPIIVSAGIDPLHFGVIICYALQIGIVTPPVGVGLYIVSDIGNMKLEDVILGALPYIIPLVVSLFLITYVPQLSLWLPNLIM